MNNETIPLCVPPSVSVCKEQAHFNPPDPSILRALDIRWIMSLSLAEEDNKNSTYVI